MRQQHAHPLPFPINPRRAGEPEPDLLGFGLLHRAIVSGTAQTAAALTAIAHGQPCDRPRRVTLCDFAKHVLDELDVHHQREDDVLWPVIAASAGPLVDLAPLVDDHEAMHDLINRTTPQLARFADGGDVTELAQLFTVLATHVSQHIADEEATVFPVMRANVSAHDFARCEQLFTKGSSFARLKFMLPWIIQQCTPDELRQVRTKAPLPLKVLLRIISPGWRQRHRLAVGEATATDGAAQ